MVALQKLYSEFLENFGNTVLSPLKGKPKLKLISVMVLIPLILNAINFWVIDNILQLKTDEHGNEEIKEIYKKEEELENASRVGKFAEVEINMQQNISLGNSKEKQKYAAVTPNVRAD